MPGTPSRLDHSPFVHVTARAERLVLAVLRQRHAETRRVLERAPHEPVVLHAVAVVGEDADAERGHLCHRRELLAPAPGRDGTRDMHVAQRRLPEVEDFAHDRRVVDGGLGVRHGDDRGEPAECRCSRAGLDGLRLFAARLTEMRVQIDEARRDDTATCIDHPIRGQIRSDRGDPSVLADDDVAAALAETVDDPPALDDDTHDTRGLRPRSLRSRPIAARLPGGRSVGLSSESSLRSLRSLM